MSTRQWHTQGGQLPPLATPLRFTKMITITLTATPARKEVLLLLPEFRNRDFSTPTAWKREGVAFVAAECLDGRIGPLAACRAPALPRFLYGGVLV